MAGEYILIVEDNRVLRQLCTDILASAGYRPIATPTAATAQKLAQEHRFRLAVIDLGLPDHDGHELALLLGLPTILISGQVVQSDPRLQKLPPSIRFMKKPFRVPHLLDVAAGLIGSS